MHTRTVMAPSESGFINPDPGTEQAREQSLKETGTEVEFSKETLEAAAKHFRQFFAEIKEHLVEREDFLDQMQLALIAKQHVAIIGFPGTAKTTAATWILNRIIDDTTGEPSFFQKQCHAEMRESEIKGPQLPREIKYIVENENGIQEITEMEMARQIQQGVAPFLYALIDEGFDAPANVLRATLLSILLNRYILDGAQIYPCRLRTAVLTSNKTLEQLRAMHGDELDALLDRFAYNYWCTDFELDPENSKKREEKYIEREADRVGGTNGDVLKVAPLKVSEMDVLHRAYDHVVVRAKGSAWIAQALTNLFIAYREVLEGKSEDFGGESGEETVVRRSKQLSPRTNNALFNVLASIAVQRYIENPQTPLAIVPEDLEKTELFLMMRAQTVALIKDKGKLDTRNDHDQAALRRRVVEGDAFQEAYREAITNNPELQALFGATTRDRPTNIDDLEHVLELCTNLVANPTVTPPGEVQRITDELTSRLPQYEAVSLKIWGAADGSMTHSGEDLYARAVETYLKLLALRASQGQTQAARRDYVVHAVSHVRKLESSFYRGKIQENVYAYLRATKDALMSEASMQPRLAHDAEKIANNVVVHFADILPAQIITQIRDAVRDACISRIADGSHATSLTPTNILIACEELEAAHYLVQAIQEGGIGGKVPVEKLAGAYGHVLKLLLNILTDAKVALEAGMNPDNQNVFLQILDRALETHGAYSSFFLSPPSKEKLEENTIASYLDKCAEERRIQNPAAQVFYEIVPSNGDPNLVQAEWTIVTAENYTFESKALRDEYEAYLRYQILNGDEYLLQLPGVTNVVEGIVSDIKKYFGKGWNGDVESMTRAGLAAYIRRTLEEGNDVIFEMPVERSDLVLRKPLVLPYAELSRVIDEEVTQRWLSEEDMRAFIISKELTATDLNINAIGNLLARDEGSQTIQLESLTTTIEDISAREVMSALHQDHIVEWDHIKDRIAKETGEIGRLVAEKHLESKRAGLEGLSQSTESIAPDALIAELSENLSTPSGAAQPLQLKHIIIPMLSGVATTEYIERRLAACFSGIQVEATSCLSEVLLDPKIDELAQCAESFGFSLEQFNQIIKPRVEAQLEKWATDRLANVATTQSGGAPDEMPTLTSDSATSIKEISEKLTREIGASLVVFARGDFEALTALKEKYGLDEAATVELGQRVAQGLALSAISTLEKRVDLLGKLQVPDAGNFDMQNLASLTRSNQAKVTEIVSSIYTTSQKLANERIKALLAGAGNYVLDTILVALDQVNAKNEACMDKFTARHNEVIRGR